MSRDGTAYTKISAFDNRVFLLYKDGITSHCSRSLRGVALLEEVTIYIYILVPDVWLIPYQWIVGGGPRPAVRQARLLEIANHGVFHANQILFKFIVVILSSPFQTKPAINLKTQTLKTGFANGFPFAQYTRKFRFKKSRVYLRKFKQIGRT